MGKYIELYLIRHGQSWCNVLNRYGTDADELTEYGITQAQEAKKLYNNWLDLDDYCVSSLPRAIKTAEILNGGTITEDKIFKEFNEIDFGTKAGTPIEFERRNNTVKISGGFHDNLFEFLKQVGGDDPYERSVEALIQLRQIAKRVAVDDRNFPHGRIGIVTHGTLMRCILATIKHNDGWVVGDDSFGEMKNLDGYKLCYRDSFEMPMQIKAINR